MKELTEKKDVVIVILIAIFSKLLQYQLIFI